MTDKPTDLFDQGPEYSADEALRDLAASMDCESRTQLRTEARILKRCADQLERVACPSKPGKSK